MNDNSDYDDDDEEEEVSSEESSKENEVCLIPTVAGTIANAMASKHGELLVPEIIKAHECIGSLFYEQYCKQQIDLSGIFFFYIHSDCNYCLGGRVSPLMEGKHKANNVLKYTYRFIESINILIN
jgi:hypothetical protein